MLIRMDDGTLVNSSHVVSVHFNDEVGKGHTVLTMVTGAELHFEGDLRIKILRDMQLAESK